MFMRATYCLNAYIHDHTQIVLHINTVHTYFCDKIVCEQFHLYMQSVNKHASDRRCNWKSDQNHHLYSDIDVCKTVTN